MFKKISISFGTPDIDDAPDIVIGREGLVAALWNKLKSSSVRLLSERRMGKTWVLKLAIAKRPDWAIPILVDVEDTNSAAEFVWKLNRQLHRNGLITNRWWQQVQDWFRVWTQRLQGKRIGGVEIPKIDSWDSLLEDTCGNFIEKAEGKKAVLMFDELPFFLDKIIKNKKEEEAIGTLDKLRCLRQSLPSLRMLFCGSLGLHIVFRKLQQEGYAGRPVNDMPPFEVPPLEPEDAYYLSGCLLRGEDVPCSDIHAVARAIAKASSGVPFYIQHIVNWMANQTARSWTPEDALSVPGQLFNAPGDPAEFFYYSVRLDTHYPEDIVEMARAALDILSRSKEGLHFDELLNLLRHSPKTLRVDPDRLLEVMHILNNDHYVVKMDAHWCFKLQIVRKWWNEARGRFAI